MSDRPANGTWTVETLREYLLSEQDSIRELFKTKIEAAEKLTNLALDNSKEAVAKAENANNERFRTTNEWRQTVNDITGGLATKAEVNSLATSIGALTTRFERMESSNVRREGDRVEARGQTNWNANMAMLSLGVIASIVLSIIDLLRH